MTILKGLAAAILLVLCGIQGLNSISAANTAKNAMPIETKYMAKGAYRVDYAEFDAQNGTWGKYEVWYPAGMANSTETYPLIVMANGTGTKASAYKDVFKQLASWGFIVVGNEDENSRTGASSAASLDFMLNANADASSVFYGKIDTGSIGIAGHSQGGIGAINAVTEQANGGMYKAIYSISATSRYHADELSKSAGNDAMHGEGWSIDATKINIPIMMVAGTGYFDAGSMNEYTATLADGQAQGICPLWWLSECYSTIPASVSKVIGRVTGKDHGDMLRASNGYMTAWFMYWLKGDAEAGSAFFGDNAEILANSKWQDVQAIS